MLGTYSTSKNYTFYINGANNDDFSSLIADSCFHKTPNLGAQKPCGDDCFLVNATFMRACVNCGTCTAGPSEESGLMCADACPIGYVPNTAGTGCEMNERACPEYITNESCIASTSCVVQETTPVSGNTVCETECANPILFKNSSGTCTAKSCEEVGVENCGAKTGCVVTEETTPVCRTECANPILFKNSSGTCTAKSCEEIGAANCGAKTGCFVNQSSAELCTPCLEPGLYEPVPATGLCRLKSCAQRDSTLTADGKCGPQVEYDAGTGALVEGQPCYVDTSSQKCSSVCTNAPVFAPNAAGVCEEVHCPNRVPINHADTSYPFPCGTDLCFIDTLAATPACISTARCTDPTNYWKDPTTGRCEEIVSCALLPLDACTGSSRCVLTETVRQDDVEECSTECKNIAHYAPNSNGKCEPISKCGDRELNEAAEFVCGPPLRNGTVCYWDTRLDEIGNEEHKCTEGCSVPEHFNTTEKNVCELKDCDSRLPTDDDSFPCGNYNSDGSTVCFKDTGITGTCSLSCFDKPKYKENAETGICDFVDCHHRDFLKFQDHPCGKDCIADLDEEKCRSPCLTTVYVSTDPNKIAVSNPHDCGESMSKPCGSLMDAVLRLCQTVDETTVAKNTLLLAGKKTTQEEVDRELDFSNEEVLFEEGHYSVFGDVTLSINTSILFAPLPLPNPVAGGSTVHSVVLEVLESDNIKSNKVVVKDGVRVTFSQLNLSIPSHIDSTALFQVKGANQLTALHFKNVKIVPSEHASSVDYLIVLSDGKFFIENVTVDGTGSAFTETLFAVNVNFSLVSSLFKNIAGSFDIPSPSSYPSSIIHIRNGTVPHASGSAGIDADTTNTDTDLLKGIYILTLKDSRFENISISGSAIFSTMDDNKFGYILSNVSFTAINSSKSGAAFFHMRGYIHYLGTEVYASFTHLHAGRPSSIGVEGVGGALGLYGVKNLLIGGETHFINCTAVKNGGAIYYFAMGNQKSFVYITAIFEHCVVQRESTSACKHVGGAVAVFVQPYMESEVSTLESSFNNDEVGSENNSAIYVGFTKNSCV